MLVLRSKPELNDMTASGPRIFNDTFGECFDGWLPLPRNNSWTLLCPTSLLSKKATERDFSHPSFSSRQ
jgi:hypothetical protein